MKNIGKKLICFWLSLVFVFSFVACGTIYSNLDQLPSNPVNTTDELEKHYQNIKSAGFDDDYDTFLSVVGNNVPYVMPSDNGYVTVIAREESPYRSQFSSRNGYIFAAQPLNGYYFAGWEAYDSQGGYVDTSRTMYEEGEEFKVQYNVIGDYSVSGAIRFVRALFTNDKSRLVDTPSVEFEVEGDDGSLQIAPLPAKMVKGTVLYQLVTPSEGYCITRWSTFYATYDTMPGNENIIIGGNSVSNSLYENDYMNLVIVYDEKSVMTGRNNSFGIPDSIYLKAQRQADVIPVFIFHSSLSPTTSPHLEPTDFCFSSPYDNDRREVEFITRGHGVYLAPRSQYDGNKFYGWYDWDGNLLSNNYVYIDENFDGDVLYIQYRTGYFDERLYYGEFSKISDYLRFNPINGGTEWEVAYNHDNDRFIDVLEIPGTYLGKPVTKIADRGFAKSWVRITEEVYQWWFEQSHPLIGRLVVPKTVKEVGDFAFATLRNNVSTSSLTYIAEDTDGDNWIDKYTDITFEVEFLSAQTKVTPYTFSQSGNTFIGIKAQLSQILNQLLDIYLDVDSGAGFNGEGRLSLNIYPEQIDNEENPWIIYLPESMIERSRGNLIYVLFCEFRHFMQLAAVGEIDGVSLKNDIGEQYKTLVSDNLQNFISSGNEYYEQFIVNDAYAFAYAWFGYNVCWSRIVT